MNASRESVGSIPPDPQGVIPGRVAALGDVRALFHGGRVCGGTASLHPESDNLERGLSVAVCTYRRTESLSRFLHSMAGQEEVVRQVVIVDASEDRRTEEMITRGADPTGRVPCLVYVRVGDGSRGLTRQRNIALRLVTSQHVAFFDDDVVLRADCLSRLYEAGSTTADEVVGAGALIENDLEKPRLLWYLRRALGIVSTLQPGRYCRSGISTPWAFAGATTEVIEGDWLQGGATMWRTRDARDVRFREAFRGYGNSEDLEFSLRVRPRGRMIVVGSARVLHLHDPAGRPPSFEMGFRTAANLHDIHSRLLPGRRRRDALWFFYAFGADALLRSIKLFWPIGFRERLAFLRGRFAALRDLWRAEMVRARNTAVGERAQ